jgi:NDP-sugar pyrophosphorylase family protein
MITVVVSYKEYQIPYGIFNTNSNGKLINIIEKPKKNYLVNTGLYVLNPKIFKYIKKNHYLDFDSLLKIMKNKKLKIGLFPVENKNWNDVGQWTEYRQATKNFYEQY